MNQHILKPTAVGNLNIKDCYQYAPLTNHMDACFKTSTQKNRKTYSCVVIVLVICVLLFCTLCVAFSVYTLTTMTVMEDRLASLEVKKALLTTKCKSTELPRQQEKHLNPEKENTEENQISNPFKREKRNRFQTGHGGTSFVHLVGKNHSDYTANDGSMTLFKWNKAERYRNLHGLSLQPNEEDVTAIRILNQGVYLVYAQVAVVGRADRSIHFDCSHATVRKRNGSWTSLLSSLLTQDKLGQEYREYFDDDDDKRPQDTQLQMGVFFLLPGDELSVQIPSFCLSTDYSSSPTNTYFGMVKLG